MQGMNQAALGKRRGKKDKEKESGENEEKQERVEPGEDGCYDPRGCAKLRGGECGVWGEGNGEEQLGPKRRERQISGTKKMEEQA